MLPPSVTRWLRPLVLVGLVAAFPLLYVAGTTLGSHEASVAALSVTGVVVGLAALSY